MRKLFIGNIGCLFLGAVVFFNQVQLGVSGTQYCGIESFSDSSDTINFFENMVVAAVTDWSYASRTGTLINPNIGSSEAAFIQTQGNLYDALYTESNTAGYLHSSGTATVPTPNGFLDKSCTGSYYGMGLAPGDSGVGYPCATAGCGKCAYSFYKDAMQGLYDYALANTGLFACSGTAGVTSFTVAASYSSFATTTGLTSPGSLATDYICVTALKSAIDGFNSCNNAPPPFGPSPFGDMRTGVALVHGTCSALDYVGPELFMNLLVAAVVDFMTIGSTPQTQANLASNLYGVSGGVTATSLPSHSTYLRTSGNFGTATTGSCGLCAYNMYSSMVTSLAAANSTTGSYACVASGKTPTDFTLHTYYAFTTNAGVSAYDLLTDTVCMSAVLGAVGTFNSCSGSAGTSYDVRTGLVSTRTTCVDLDFIGYNFFDNLVIAAVMDFQQYCYTSGCAVASGHVQSSSALATSLYSASNSLTSTTSYPNPYLVTNLSGASSGTCGYCAYCFYRHVWDALNTYYVANSKFVCMYGPPSATNPMSNTVGQAYSLFLQYANYPSAKAMTVDETCITVIQSAIDTFNGCTGSVIPSGFDIRTGKKLVRSQCVDLDFVTGQFFKNLLVPAVIDTIAPVGVQVSGSVLRSTLYDATNGITDLTNPGMNTFLKHNLGDTTANSCGKCAYSFYTDAFTAMNEYTTANPGSQPYACADAPAVTASQYNNFDIDAGVAIADMPTSYTCIGALQLAIDNFYNCLQGASYLVNLDIRTGNSTTMCDIPPIGTTQFLDFEVSNSAYTVMMTTAYGLFGAASGPFPTPLANAIAGYDGVFPCGVCFENFYQDMILANHSPSGVFLGSSGTCDASVIPPTTIYTTSCVTSATMQNAIDKLSVCAGTYNILNTAESFPVSAPVQALWNHAVWGLEAVVVCGAAHDTTTVGGLADWKTCLTYIGTSPVAGSSNSLVDPTNASDLTCFTQLAAAVFADSGTGGAKTVCATTASTACITRLNLSTTAPFTSPYLGLSVVPTSSLLSQFQTCSGFALTTTAPTTTCTSTVPDTYLSYVPLVVIAIEAVDPATAAKAIFDSTDYTSSPLGGILANCFGCWAKLAAEVNAGFAVRPDDKQACIENPYGTGDGSCAQTTTIITALSRFNTCSGDTLIAESPPTGDYSKYSSVFFDNLLGAAAVDWSYAYHANGGARPGLNNGTQTAANLKTHIYAATYGFGVHDNFLKTSTTGVGLDAPSGYGLCAYRFYTDIFNQLDNYNRVTGNFICTSSGTDFTTQYHYQDWTIGSSKTDYDCIAAIQLAIDNYDNCVDDTYDIRTAMGGAAPQTTICDAEIFAQLEAEYNPYTAIMNAALQVTTGSGGTFPVSVSAGFTAVGDVRCNTCYTAFFDAIVVANNGDALYAACQVAPNNIYTSSCTLRDPIAAALTAFSLCAGTNNIMNTAEAHTVSKPVADLWNLAIFSLEPIAICSYQYDPLGGTTPLASWESCLVTVSGGSATPGASIALVPPTIDTDLFCFKQLGHIINTSSFYSDCATVAGLATDGTGNCYNALTARTFGWTAPYQTMSVAPLSSYLDQFYACSGIELETASPTSTCNYGAPPPGEPSAPYNSYIPILAIALEADDPAAAAEAVFNSADLQGGILPTYVSCFGCWARLAAELNAAFANSAADKAICMANIYGTGANMCGPGDVSSTSAGTTGTTSMLNALTNFYSCSGYTLAADSTSSDDCVAADYDYSNMYENMMVAAIVDWSVGYHAASGRPGMNVGVQVQSSLGSNLYGGSAPLALAVTTPLANYHLSQLPSPAHRLASTHSGCSLCAYRLYTDVFNALDNYNKATGLFACTTSATAYTTANNYSGWALAAGLGASPAVDATNVIVTNETCVSTVQFAIDNFNNCPGRVADNDIRTGGLLEIPTCSDADFVSSNFFENLLVAAITDWMNSVYNEGGSLQYSPTGGAAGSGADLIAAMYSVTNVGLGKGLSSITNPVRNTYLFENLGSTTVTDCGACAFQFYLDAIASLNTYYTQYSAYACVDSTQSPTDFATVHDYTNFATGSGHASSYWATNDNCIFALQLAINNFYACQGRNVDIVSGILPYQCHAEDFVGNVDNPTLMYQNMVLAAVVDFMYSTNINSGVTTINGGAATSFTYLRTNLYTGSHALDTTTNPLANTYLATYSTSITNTPRAVNDCGYCAYLFYQNVIKGLYNYQYEFNSFACVGTAGASDFNNQMYYKEFNAITGVFDPQILAYDRACVSAVQEAIDTFTNCAGAGHTTTGATDLFDIRTGSGIDGHTCLELDLVQTGFFDNILVAAVVDFMQAGAGSPTAGQQTQADLAQNLYNVTANANALTAETYPARISYLWHNLADTTANSCGSCAYNYYVDVIAALYGYAAANSASAQTFACVNQSVTAATVFSVAQGYSLFTTDAVITDIKSLSYDYVCVGALQAAIDNYYNCAGSGPSKYDIRTGTYTTMCDVPVTPTPTTTFLSFDEQYGMYSTLMTAALGTAAFPFTNGDYTALKCKSCLQTFFDSIRANKTHLLAAGAGLCDTAASGGIYATSCLTEPTYVVPALQAFEVCAGTYNEMFVRPRSPVTTKMVKDIWGEVYWTLGPIAYCAANAAADPITGAAKTAFEACLIDPGTMASTLYFTVPDNASDFTCILQLASDIYNDNETTVGARTVCKATVDATCISRLQLDSSPFTSPYLGLSVPPKFDMLTEFELCAGFPLQADPTPQCVGPDTFTIPDRLSTWIPYLSIALAAPSPVAAIEAVLNSADLVAQQGSAVCWPCWAQMVAYMNAQFAANPADRLLCMDNMFGFDLSNPSCSTSNSVQLPVIAFSACSNLSLNLETPAGTCGASDYSTGGSMYENLVIAAVVDWSNAYATASGRPGLSIGIQTPDNLKPHLFVAPTPITTPNAYLNTAITGIEAADDCGRCAYRFYTDVMYMLDNYRRANPTLFACGSSDSLFATSFSYPTWTASLLGTSETLETQFGCVAAIQQAINNFNNCVGPVATVQYDIKTGLATTQCTQQEFLDFDSLHHPYSAIMGSLVLEPGFLSTTPPAVPCQSCFATFWTLLMPTSALLYTFGAAPCAGTNGIYTTTCLQSPTVSAFIQYLEICAGTHNHLNTKPVYPVSSAVEALWNRAVWSLLPIVRCVAAATADPISGTGLTDWESCLVNVSVAPLGGESISLSVPTNTNDINCFNALASNIYNSAVSSVPTTSASTDCPTTTVLDGTDSCLADLEYRTKDFSVPYLGWSTIPMNSYLEQFEQCSGFVISTTSPTAPTCTGTIPSPHDSYIPLLSIALLAVDPAAAAEGVFNSTDLSSAILPTFQACYGCWARFAAEVNAGFTLSPADKSVCLQNMYGTATGECGDTDTITAALANFSVCAGSVALTVGPTTVTTCAASDYNYSEFYSNLVVGAVVDWSNSYYKESPLVSARPGFNNGVQTSGGIMGTLYAASTGLAPNPSSTTVPVANAFIGDHLADTEGCGLCAYRLYTDLFNAIDNYNRKNPTVFPCTTTSGNAFATANSYSSWNAWATLGGKSINALISDESCVSVLQFAIDNFHSCSGTAANIDVRIGSAIGPNVAVSGNFVGTGMFENLFAAAVIDWMHATYNGGGTLAPTIDGGDAGSSTNVFANLYSNAKVAAGTGLSSLTSPTKISFLYSVLPSNPAIPSAVCAYNFYKDVLADLFNYNQAYSGYACVGSGKLPSNFATAMDYANFATYAGQPASFFATDETCIYAIQSAVNNFYTCNGSTADILTGVQPYQCSAANFTPSADTTNMYQNWMVAAITDYMYNPTAITGSSITGLTTLLNNMYVPGTNINCFLAAPPFFPVPNAFLMGYAANSSLINKGINDCAYCGYLFYKNVIKSLYDYHQRTGLYGCIGNASASAFLVTDHDYLGFNFLLNVLTSADFTMDYECVAAVQPAIDLFMTCPGAGQTVVSTVLSPYDIRTGLPVVKDNTCSEVDFVETGIFQDVLVASVVDFMYAYHQVSSTTADAASQSPENLYIAMFMDPTNVNRLTAISNPVHNTFLINNTENSCSTCVYLFYRGVIMGLHDYAAAHTSAPSANKFACTNGRVASDFSTLQGYSLFATVTGVTDISTFATDYVCVEALQAALNAFHECVAPGLIKTDVRTGTDSTMCDTAISPPPHVFIDLDAQFGIYNTTMSAALDDEALPAAFTTALETVDCKTCITTFYNTIKTIRAELKDGGTKPCDSDPAGIYATSCTTESTYVVPAMKAFELCAGIENKMYLKPRYPVSKDTQAIWNFAVWGLEPVVLCGVNVLTDPATDPTAWKSCLTTVPSVYGASPALTTPADPSELQCFIELASAARTLYPSECTNTVSGACLTDLTTRTEPFTSPYTELSVEVKNSLLDQFYVCSGFKLETTAPNTICGSAPTAPYQSYIPMLSIALQTSSPALAASGILRDPDLIAYAGSLNCWPCYARMAAELTAEFNANPSDKQICIDNIYGTGTGKCETTATMAQAISRFDSCSSFEPAVEAPSNCLIAPDYGTATFTYYRNLVVAAVVDWSYTYQLHAARPAINAAIKNQVALQISLYGSSGHQLTGSTIPPVNSALFAGLASPGGCNLCAYRFYVDAVNSLSAYNEAVTGEFACTSSDTAYMINSDYNDWYATSGSVDPAMLASNYTCVGALQFAINNFNNCAGDPATGLPIVDIKTGDFNQICARDEFLNFDAINGVYTAIMQSAFALVPVFPTSLNTTGLTCAPCLTAYYQAIVDANTGHALSNIGGAPAICDGVDGITLIPEIYSIGSGSCIDPITPNAVYLALKDLHVCMGTQNLLNLFPTFHADPKVDALWNHAYWGLEPVVACGASDFVADPLSGTGSPSGKTTWQNCLNDTTPGSVTGANSYFDVTKFSPSDMICFNKLASNVYNQIPPAPATTKADCSVTSPTPIPNSCLFDVSVNTTTAFANGAVGLSVTPSDSLLVQFYKCSGFSLSLENPTGSCTTPANILFVTIAPWVSIAVESPDPASAALEALTRAYISSPSSPEGGQGCWNCYARLAAELQARLSANAGDLAACSANPYDGDSCLTSNSVSTAVFHYDQCASRTMFLGPNFQCTDADYNAWEDANIPLMVMYLASTATSYSSALTSLRSLLGPVHTTAGGYFNCQYCFEKLLFDLYTLAHTVVDIGPCWDDLTLPECRVTVGPVIDHFEQCSGFPLDYNHSPAGSSTPVCSPALYPTTNFFDNIMTAAVVDFTKTGDVTGAVKDAPNLASKLSNGSTGLGVSTTPSLNENLTTQLIGASSIPTACGACAYHFYTNLIKAFNYHGTTDEACSITDANNQYGGGDPNVYNSWAPAVGGPAPLLIFQKVTCISVVQTAIDIFNNCAQNINDVRTGTLSTQCSADQFLEVDASWGVYELFMNAVKNSDPPPVAFVTQVGPLPCGNCFLDFYTTLYASRSTIFDVAAACVVNEDRIYSMGPSSTNCIDTTSVSTTVYGAILELERCAGMTNQLYLQKTYHPTLPEQLLFNRVIRSYKPVVECVDALLTPIVGVDPGNTPGTITAAWKTCLGSYQQTGSPALTMPNLDMTCFQQLGHHVADVTKDAAAYCGILTTSPNALDPSCLSKIALRDLSLYVSPNTMPPPRSMFDEFYLCAGFPMNTNVDPITCAEGAVQRDQLGYSAYVTIALAANDTSNASYSTLTDPVLQPLIGSVACFDCFARFSAEMKALPNFASDCANSFALSCWEAVGINVVDAPGYNFHVCSGLTIFNDGSGYQCTIEEYNIWQSVSLIQNTMDDIVNALSAEMAVTEYKRLMGEIKTANPEHPFNCDYCFQVLVGTLYAIGITNDLAPCVQDPTSNGCYALPGVSDAYTKFQQCSSMRFNYLPHTITPLDPRTASNTTTTIAPVTTTETPIGGGGGDGTTTTTTLIPFETTTTTAAPPTTEPPTTSSKGAGNGSGVSLFGYWLLCVGTIIMTLL